MIAVFETGGKQYKVSEGSLLDIECLTEEEGKIVEFNTVLLLSDKGNTQVGAPYVDAVIKAEIINHFRDEKKIIFKFKKKTGYKLTAGHRQSQTTIKIISIKGKTSKEATSKDVEAPVKTSKQATTVASVTKKEKKTTKA